MASFVHYREISYIVDLLSWNTIVGKIYYRDNPSLYTFFSPALVQITNKIVLCRWTKGKLGYLGLIILIIAEKYVLNSNQIT